MHSPIAAKYELGGIVSARHGAVVGRIVGREYVDGRLSVVGWRYVVRTDDLQLLQLREAEIEEAAETVASR